MQVLRAPASDAPEDPQSPAFLELRLGYVVAPEHGTMIRPKYFVPALAAVGSIAWLACSGPDGPAGPQGTAGEAGAQGARGVRGPRAQRAPAGRRAPEPRPSMKMVERSRRFRSRACRRATASTASSRSSRRASTTRSTWSNVSSATPETEWTTTGAAVRQLPRDRRAPAARHRQRRDDRRRRRRQPRQRRAAVPRSGDGALSSANYTGSATVAEVYCTTCHAVTNANDPHKTGIPWTPGLLPARGRRGRRRDQHREEPLDA